MKTKGEHEMASKWQKQVKELYNPETGIESADKVVAKSDGTIEVKESYFYHRVSASQWAAEIEAEMDNHGIAHGEVTSRDDYRTWPQTSYVVAIIHPAE